MTQRHTDARADMPWTHKDALVTEREELFAERNEIEDELDNATYALGDATCRLAMTPRWRIRTRVRHLLDRRRQTRWLQGTHRAWHRNKARIEANFRELEAS